MNRSTRRDRTSDKAANAASLNYAIATDVPSIEFGTEEAHIIEHYLVVIADRNVTKLNFEGT